MKRLLLPPLFALALNANELENFLSPTYNELFDTELKKSFVQSKYNSLSWISPVTLGFERSWSNQIEGGWHPRNSYFIGIEQPIFKSGGIFYGIKYAKSNYSLAKATTIGQKVKLNTQAHELVLQIKQLKLSIAKLKLQIKNAKIEIKRAKELFNAGLFSSVELDNALIKKDEANIALFDLEANLANLIAAFKKISNKDINSIKLPKVRLLTKDEFLANNIEIDIAKAKRQSSKNYTKMVRSKYLPTISLGARYTKISNAQPHTKDAFTNYSLKVSMPISVNTSNDLEVAKLDSIIDGIKIKNTKIAQSVDYDTTLKRVKSIEQKIAIANKQIKAYKRLYKSTNEQYKAGQKSIDDVELIKNSLKIKRLDKNIYTYAKSIEILKLYEKVR